MRRTDMEFKAEILRRRTAYRAHQRKRRKMLLTAVGCVALVFAGFFLSLPMLASGGSSGDMAVNQMSVGRSEAENSIMGDCEIPGAAIEEPLEDVEYGVMEGEGSEQAASTGATNTGTESIVLKAEDEAVLVEYLDGEWFDTMANCICDFILVIEGETYRYHSDCGTFQNMNSKRFMQVLEEERLVINKILQQYIEP